MIIYAFLKKKFSATEKTLVDDDAFGDDDLEEQLEEAGIVRAPDGGYGWVVVFASFLANMIVDGVIFSISESIVPLWEKEFNATTSAVTIATSLLAGCYLLSGLLFIINGFLEDKNENFTTHFKCIVYNSLIAFLNCVLVDCF